MTTETVYRGGSTPHDQEDWQEWAAGYGRQELPVLYAHTDRHLVEREYATRQYCGSTHVHRLVIDTARFLDCRDPAGMARWRALGQDERRAREAGYRGAIYPDQHDWDCAGFEVAIWDARALISP